MLDKIWEVQPCPCNWPCSHLQIPEVLMGVGIDMILALHIVDLHNRWLNSINFADKVRDKLNEPVCNGIYPGHDYRASECHVRVCQDCDEHAGLDRCYCGWARDGGDGQQQLVDMGEQIEVGE